LQFAKSMANKWRHRLKQEQYLRLTPDIRRKIDAAPLMLGICRYCARENPEIYETPILRASATLGDRR
jgi:hypothetical protein